MFQLVFSRNDFSASEGFEKVSAKEISINYETFQEVKCGARLKIQQKFYQIENEINKTSQGREVEHVTSESQWPDGLKKFAQTE